MVSFNDNKTQLLCTFATNNNYKFIINKIIDNHTIYNKKIYVLNNYDNNNIIYLTYNVFFENFYFLNNTISVHRKKLSNTLYTINSLNRLISLKNNNKINWNEYKNCILLTNNCDLKIIKTSLFEIINI